LLIFTYHVEDNNTLTAPTSVTWGGQNLTPAVDAGVSEGYTANTGIWYLKEADIASASGTSFSVTWNASPSRTPAYSSVFLSGVNQSTPIGGTATGSSTANGTVTITAAPQLQVLTGELDIFSATNGGSGTYSVKNGFTEAIEFSPQSADACVGYKAGSGQYEEAEVEHSKANRQVITSCVIQAN
jgi:hypothetical protein